MWGAIAACVAPERSEAADFAAAVAVDYQPLEAVVDARTERTASPALVHEYFGDNLYQERTYAGGAIEAAGRAAETSITREFAPAGNPMRRWNAAVCWRIAIIEGALVHHADSFAIARGWHLDLCGLDAFEVTENDDIANRARSNHDPTKQIGGAMDLAVGVKRLWVAMEHGTKAVGPRIRTASSYPLAARGVVKRVYTDHAVLEVTPCGFTMLDIIPGMTQVTLQMRTEARLIWPS